MLDGGRPSADEIIPAACNAMWLLFTTFLAARPTREAARLGLEALRPIGCRRWHGCLEGNKKETPSRWLSNKYVYYGCNFKTKCADLVPAPNTRTLPALCASPGAWRELSWAGIHVTCYQGARLSQCALALMSRGGNTIVCMFTKTRTLDDGTMMPPFYILQS